MKTILTYGTYDLLHIGHINLLKRARAMGDFLVVGLSTDAFNAMKHKESFLPFEERKTILESLRFVDLVIPEVSWDQKEKDIEQYRADVLVMGNDWEGKFDHLKDKCEVVYLERTPAISSTLLKARLNE